MTMSAECSIASRPALIADHRPNLCPIVASPARCESTVPRFPLLFVPAASNSHPTTTESYGGLYGSQCEHTGLGRLGGRGSAVSV
jgi:hypothetical protein